MHPTLWRNSRLDALPAGLSVAQLAMTVALAAAWNDAGPGLRVLTGVLVAATTTYNIIVISHLFTHQPWFRAAGLNRAASLLNSANIAQSVQAYELTHVRNHHRYNNDRQDAAGRTADRTSTFRHGDGENHASLLRYVVPGALETFVDMIRTWATVVRGFRVGRSESGLLELASRRPAARRRELRGVALDRAAQAGYVLVLAAVSWRFVLLCYLPAVLVAFALVNVQNYYRHFGAEPESRYANSVSHYGRIYNLLTFNDGYHQEHHLRPPTHWSRLPEVHERMCAEFETAGRVESPVPAIVGFLDRGRGDRAPKRTAA